jgi:hypothetical protein
MSCRLILNSPLFCPEFDCNLHDGLEFQDCKAGFSNDTYVRMLCEMWGRFHFPTNPNWWKTECDCCYACSNMKIYKAKIGSEEAGKAKLKCARCRWPIYFKFSNHKESYFTVEEVHERVELERQKNAQSQSHDNNPRKRKFES